jgi:hypothetical protein
MANESLLPNHSRIIKIPISTMGNLGKIDGIEKILKEKIS